jgi:hypothetical protein
MTPLACTINIFARQLTIVALVMIVPLLSVYEAITIVIDDCRVRHQIDSSLTDDPGGVIYGCKMFTVQATRP